VRILSPVAAPEEVEPLTGSGADELYCGLFPQRWYERWGRAAWPNRRGPGPGNLGSVEEVLRLADAAHAGAGVPLYLTLNQQFYPDDQADLLLEIARELVTAGAVDAFVVTDPGFMTSLRDELPDCRVFASTVSVALNSGAVRFLASLGCSRIILSRHLTLPELSRLRAAAPDVELEVFLLNDNCRFEEGLCSTAHSIPGFGVYCATPWEVSVRRVDPDGPIDDPEQAAAWHIALDEHREYLRHLTFRGTGGGRTALPLGPCGLCALPDLIDLGISSGKIVGREAGLYRKLRSVQAVRHLRDLYLERGDADAVKAAAVALRSDPEGCAAGYSCYYRSARHLPISTAPHRPMDPKVIAEPGTR
jgi:U32 family peptidase